MAGTRRQVIRSLRRYRNGALVIYLALEPVEVTTKNASRKKELDNLHVTASSEMMGKLRLLLKITRKLGQSQSNLCIEYWLLWPREALGGLSVLRYIKENPATQATDKVKFPPFSG